jgi:hypothetical protein
MFYRDLGKRLTSVASLLCVTSAAVAVPLLQMDVKNGVYVGGQDQTTYATSTTFTLYALYSGSTVPSGNFYISAAIQPKQLQSVPPANFGNFTVNGSSSTVWNYGVPPVAVADDAPKVQDLGKHDIYPTYYKEFGFTFNPANQVKAYDTSLLPGANFVAGTGMYYQAFVIDITGLLNIYSLHFDLYNETMKNIGSKTSPVTAATLGSFAPFSHDAQSPLGGGGGGGSTQVPDGGITVALLGFALAGIGIARRRLA